MVHESDIYLHRYFSDLDGLKSIKMVMLAVSLYGNNRHSLTEQTLLLSVVMHKTFVVKVCRLE